MHLQQTLQRFRKQFKTNRRNGASKKKPRRLQLELLETRAVPTVSVINNFQGLSSGIPDTCGAAGPNSYIETVNHSVAIYNKTTGAQIAPPDGLGHFLFTVGGITAVGGLSDATMCFDEVTGQFIVADMDWNSTAHKGALDFAVSKNSNPTALDTANWNFYQINTENGYDNDYPGNFGFNADAFVFTFQEFDPNGLTSHTLVTAVKQSDLAAGGSINFFQFDRSGFSFRPVTMHDSVAGGPMWLVQEGGDNTSINIVRIDNILTTSPFVTTFNKAVNSYNSANPLLNPDGTRVVPPTNNGQTDSRIMKAAEANNTIVACQTVGVNSNEDDARWYEINVSDINNPQIADQGNVRAGANTYIAYPGIDINPAGDIGMSFLQVGNDTSTDYMSVYVTGRTTSDAAGTMEASVEVQAGDSNNTAGRVGDFSGINVDGDGTFWIANEFTQSSSGATEIAHFTLGPEAFLKNGVLWVTGTNADDNVTLHPNPTFSFLTQVLDNGVDLGNFFNVSFSSVDVELFGGNDTVNVENTQVGVPVTIDEGSGTDTVNISPSAEFLDNIQGNVIVRGGSGVDTLNITDQNNGFNDTWTITGFSITRTAAATIFYHGQNFVNITGGTGNLTYNVLSTEFAFSTSIDTGPGIDTVNVQSVDPGSLSINNVFKTSNHDTVNIGSKAPSLSGTLGNIAGTVNVANASGGGTTLNVDDSGDTTGRTFTITNGSITGTAFAGAVINYTGGQVNTINLLGGDGGNTFNVQSTASGTTTSINVNDTATVNSNNHVNIGSTAPSLGGTLVKIAGPVNVSSLSQTALVVDDSGDTTGQTWTVTSTSITGTGFSGTITYAQVSTLSILGGSGGNTFNVQSTAAGTTTSITTDDTTTSSNNTVNIGSLAPSLGGTLANIAGPVNVSSGSGNTVLTIDDSGDATGRSATITNNTITGLSPAAITYTKAFGTVTSLTILGGRGGNTFNVQSTLAGTTTNLIANPVGLLSGGGTVNVGNAGSVQGIAGVLNIENPPSINTIVVDDSAHNTSVATTVTLSTLGTNPSDIEGNSDSWGQIVGLAPANINYEYRDTRSPLTIKGGGGTGLHSWNVLATGVATVINGGSGPDTFNVAAGLAAPLAVDGGGGTNTLVGPNVNDTWNITSVNGGTMDGNVTFNSIQNLTGGSANDTFVFSNGMGVTGGVNGGGGFDTLDYHLYLTGVTVNLLAGTATGTGSVTNVHNVTGSPFNDTISGDNAGDVINLNGGKDIVKGGTANDTFILGATQLAGTTVTGNGGNDTLIGANIINIWTLTGAGAGNVNGVVTFSGISNLVGGTSNDTFKFKTGGSVAGTINGGGGTDTLDYSLNTAAITVNLQTSAATFTGGFSNINNLIGGGGAVNTLIGTNANSVWTISGAASGNVNGAFTFSDIDALVGGTGVNVFAFTAAASKVTSINGGSATGNWLDYSSYTAAVSVNLTTGKATGVNGGLANSISNIQNVHGGNFGNTLTGSNTQGNILIGGSGPITIKGGSGGRSILIADAGKSVITGGSGGAATGGDIMIAGTTVYDTMTSAHEAALQSILAEWQSADSATDRFLSILNGTGGGSHLNGGNFLNFGSTVFDNGKANTLTAATGAGEGVDWFFALEGVGHTKVLGRDAGDHTNNT